jgi:hypothetical protein
MPTLEDYLTDADSLAQEVVDAWGLNIQAGNRDSLTVEFLDVLDKACRYQEKKWSADSYRAHHALSEEGAKAEDTAWRTFIQAYVPWMEKHRSESHKG